jgi:hypothetical protein
LRRSSNGLFLYINVVQPNTFLTAATIRHVCSDSDPLPQREALLLTLVEEALYRAFSHSLPALNLRLFISGRTYLTFGFYSKWTCFPYSKVFVYQEV